MYERIFKMKSNAYKRGHSDYMNSRTCLVYRKLDGKLVWDSLQCMLSCAEPEVWAKNYIMGWETASLTF